MLANIYVPAWTNNLEPRLFLLSQLPVSPILRTLRFSFQDSLKICEEITQLVNTCGCANSPRKDSLIFIALQTGTSHNGSLTMTEFLTSQSIGHRFLVRTVKEMLLIQYGWVVIGTAKGFTIYTHRLNLDTFANI